VTRQATVKNVLNTLNVYGWGQRVLVDVDGALRPLNLDPGRGQQKYAEAHYTSEDDGITDKDVVLVAGKAIPHTPASLDAEAGS
jgi:hypothetical protein